MAKREDIYLSQQNAYMTRLHSTAFCYTKGGVRYHRIISSSADRDILATLKSNRLGAVSIRKTVLPGMAIPMLKIRRPNGRLIFNMEITIRRLDGLYIETGPWFRRGGDFFFNSEDKDTAIY